MTFPRLSTINDDIKNDLLSEINAESIYKMVRCTFTRSSELDAYSSVSVHLNGVK